MSGTNVTPRVGARVLLLDPLDRVLLIHASTSSSAAPPAPWHRSRSNPPRTRKPG